MRLLQAWTWLWAAFPLGVWATDLPTAWERIQHQQEVRVGIKIDYPPFGMLDGQGENIGFEIDMARRLAQDLGVRMNLVAVSGSNRLQKLEDGSIDLVIATMGQTPARRMQATLIEPGYYASGVGLMTGPDLSPTQWSGVRGQTVCAVQGSYFNQTVARQQLLSLQVYPSAREAKQALHDGRCSGWLFDQPAIDRELNSTDSHGFQATLPPLLTVAWSMAIERRERDGRWHRWLQDQVGLWHREGFLLDLERRWHLSPSSFLSDMHQRWSSTGAKTMCQRGADGKWPQDCLKGPIREDVDLLHPQTQELWWNGLVQTMGLVAACVILSLSLGVWLALWTAQRSPRVQALVRGALGGVRITPPLLVMGMVFLGLGGWLKHHLSWQPSGWIIAVVCLSAYAGASVFLALDQTHRHLQQNTLGSAVPSWPRTLGLAWPVIKGALVNVSKATMMASSLAVPELLSVSTTLMAETGQAAWVMNLMLLAYVALGLAVMHLLDVLGRRWRQLPP
jgi:polar amino acid transport system substrate-binding protein